MFTRSIAMVHSCSSIFVDSYNGVEDLETQEAQDKYKQQMFNMLLAVAIFSTLITVLVILTFPEKPGAKLFSCQKTKSDNKSSVASFEGDALIGNIGNPEMKEIGMLDQIMLCAKNREFVLTGIGTSYIIIYFYVLTTVLGQIVYPYGLTDTSFTIKMGLFVYGFGIQV